VEDPEGNKEGEDGLECIVDLLTSLGDRGRPANERKNGTLNKTPTMAAATLAQLGTFGIVTSLAVKPPPTTAIKRNSTLPNSPSVWGLIGDSSYVISRVHA
jgi:hypothetical protein